MFRAARRSALELAVASAGCTICAGRRNHSESIADSPSELAGVASGGIEDGAVASLGRLDVLHNNAGYGKPSRVATTSDAEFAEILRVNLCGPLYGTRAALRVMIPQRSGSIINTASNAGFGAQSERASYATAKAALINLTKNTASENGRYGIRANAICPGPIETPAFLRYAPDLDYYTAQIPLRRLGKPEDVAALAVFLASDESAFISGTAISVDGAMMARLPAPYLRPEDVTSQAARSSRRIASARRSSGSGPFAAAATFASRCASFAVPTIVVCRSRWPSTKRSMNSMRGAPPSSSSSSARSQRSRRCSEKGRQKADFAVTS
jgi:NAD(P)-dependent dehydrogenase (short-subunit alcohol dehydrogenase family)